MYGICQNGHFVLHYTSCEPDQYGRVQFVVNDTAKKVFRKGGKGKLSGKCDVCGKIPGYGHNVSHSARKTNRMWMPNIQHKMIQLKGEAAPVRRNICTQCLRTLQKDRV